MSQKRRPELIKRRSGTSIPPCVSTDRNTRECADPRSHKNLKQTKVDTYALIYEWFGSDESLQPLFLTAHQGM